MTKNKVLSFVLFAGKILLENGAETWRIEDTMERMLKSFDLGEPEVFVTTTGLFVSVDQTTKVKRIRYRTINMAKISMVNDLSRKIVSKQISFEDAEIKLKEIENFKSYSKKINMLANAGTCSFFTFLFGGGIFDAINSFLVGFILSIFLNIFNKRKLPSFLYSLFGGAILSIFSLILFNFGLGKDIDKILIGSIMPLAPGMGITNAVRDIFHGDFISGSGRAFDALMCAIAIATGVGSILYIGLSFSNI